MSTFAVDTSIPASPDYTSSQLDAFAREPWSDPRPFRHYSVERAEGVSAFRGLLFGAIFGLASWALIGCVIAAAVGCIAG